MCVLKRTRPVYSFSINIVGKNPWDEGGGEKGVWEMDAQTKRSVLRSLLCQNSQMLIFVTCPLRNCNFYNFRKEVEFDARTRRTVFCSLFGQRWHDSKAFLSRRPCSRWPHIEFCDLPHERWRGGERGWHMDAQTRRSVLRSLLWHNSQMRSFVTCP